MARVSRDPLTDDGGVAESDMPRPAPRAAKGRRGKRGAAAALGALALTSGVTAAIDATRDGTQISAGRLAITLTAHGGFKLDTCTTNGSSYSDGNGSSNSSTTSNTTQDFGTSTTTSDSTQTSGTGTNTYDTTQDLSTSISNSDSTQTGSNESTNYDNNQLSLPEEYTYTTPIEHTPIPPSGFERGGTIFVGGGDEGLPPGFTRSGTFWVGGDDSEDSSGDSSTVPYFVDNYSERYNNDKLNIGDYQPNAADHYDPNSNLEFYLDDNNENVINDNNDIDAITRENLEFKLRLMSCYG